MSEEFRDYTDRVTVGKDGIYRWRYDMDMGQNKSMLYMLEKINLFIFLGVSLGGALFIGLVRRDFGDPMVRGILLVGLAVGALMSVLYLAGFYIAARMKGGRYRIRYSMSGEGIELVWSENLREGVAAVTRSARGRWRPTLDEVSSVSFAQVVRVKSFPQWDMIDLSMIGGKFQVYTAGADFGFVEKYILDRVPERAKR